jgi:hypothetical protein
VQSECISPTEILITKIMETVLVLTRKCFKTKCEVPFFARNLSDFSSADKHSKSRVLNRMQEIQQTYEQPSSSESTLKHATTIRKMIK